MLTLNDGRSELWQWDTGRTLTVDADCSQVHFSNKVLGRSIDVDVVGGVAIIPDVLLQTDNDLNVWAFAGTAENGYTKISKTFKVNRRNKPADYVFTQTDQMTLQMIQRQIGDLADLTTEAKDTLVAAINEAAASGGAGSMDLRVADGYVQYSTDGGSTWTNLIAMADLKGDTGPAGEAGGFYTPAVTQPDANILRVAFTPSKEDMPAVAETDITLPSGGGGGGSGEDGGYYTPAVTQPTENTMQVSFTPSKATMPAVDGTEITLPAGPAGSKGDKGDKGEKGADGKSAYAYAVEGGFTGTEAEFAAKLAAEKFANPNALTFTGAVTGIYDGSAPLAVEIPSGGGGSGGSGKAKSQILINQEITEPTASIGVTLEHNFHSLTAIIHCGSSGVALTSDADGNAVSSKIALLIDTTAFGYNGRKVAYCDTNTGGWQTKMIGGEWTDDLSVYKRGFAVNVAAGSTTNNYTFSFGGSGAMLGTIGDTAVPPKTGSTVYLVTNGAFLSVGTKVVLWGEYYE